MTALRDLMAPMQADRLYMAVATDDLIEAVNIPLRARHGFFAIDYTEHTPKLFAFCATGKVELVMMTDTRRRHTLRTQPSDDPTGLMVGDIHNKLAAHGAELHMIVQTDERGRKIAKLQIAARDSRHIVITLAAVPRKTRRTGIGPFRITT